MRRNERVGTARVIAMSLSAVVFSAVTLTACGGSDETSTAAPSSLPSQKISTTTVSSAVASTVVASTSTSATSAGDTPADAPADADGGDAGDAPAPSTTAATTSSTQPGSTTSAPPEIPEDEGVDVPVDVETPPATLAPLPQSSLTGPYGASPNRPAVAVKIDNVPAARPQWGLSRADMVFEVRVESATRFLAVFQSTDAEFVGPVRSARTTDPILLGSLGQPLFAFSGANEGVRNMVAASNLVDVGGYKNAGAYYRTSVKSAPHNLLTDTDDLFGAANGGSTRSPFLFRGTSSQAAGSSPRSGLSVDIDGGPVRFVWSEADQGYLRFQGSRLTRDASGGIVVVQNVVLLDTNYRPSTVDSRSPEAQSVGSGTARVMAAGALSTGTWSRASQDATYQLVDGAGGAMALIPGRSWVVLPDPGTVSALDDGTASSLLASR